MAKREGATKRKKDFTSFNTYIEKVLKQVHPELGIRGEAMVEMDNFVKALIHKIMDVVNLLTAQSHRQTVSSREVQTAVRMVLPGELARHGVAEGTKAVTKYNSSLDGGGKGPLSARAGLQFPITRIKTRWMKPLATSSGGKVRVGDGAPVYLAAVLEYLTAEVLELAGNAAKDNKLKRINDRMILLAIRNDEELNKLAKDMILAGGVVPNIHQRLLPKK